MHDEITDDQNIHHRIRDLLHLRLDQVLPSESNPRTSMEKQPFAELKESIRENALLTPIVVRPLGDRYEIVGGHRRYRAVSELAVEQPHDKRFQRIAAILRADENENVTLLQLLDNLARADLTPQEVGASIAALMEQGMTADEVARRLSYPKRRVYKYLQVHNAPAWLKDLMKQVEVPSIDGADAPAVRAGVNFTDWLELVALYNTLHDVDVEQLTKKGASYKPRAEATVIALAQKAAREEWNSAKLRAEVKHAKDRHASSPKPQEPKSKKSVFEVDDNHVAIDLTRIDALTSAQREQLAMQVMAQLRRVGFAALIKTESSR